MKKTKKRQSEAEKGCAERLRAGSEYEPGQLIRTPCPVCGKQLNIRPRTWPYFRRRDDDSIVWLCPLCDGQLPPGKNTTNKKGGKA